MYASCTPWHTPSSALSRVSPSDHDPPAESEYPASLVSLRQPLEINPNLNPNTGVATRPLLLTRAEREFFVDNLLVRIHLIIEMVLVDQPRAPSVLASDQPLPP